MNLFSRKALDHMVQEATNAVSAPAMRVICDQPIEEALATFTYDELPVPVDQSAFLVLLGDFMRHLAEHGVGPCRGRDAARSVEEALYILEHVYQGDCGCGYEGALRDISQYGSEKISDVLSTIVDSMRNTFRRNHVRWVMTRHIGTLSWDERVAVAGLPEWKCLLGEMISGRSPAELAPACEELIMAKAASDERLAQILGPPD